MSRERYGYRENLQDILEFFGGRRVLTIADVRRYTGLNDYRTLKSRFPFHNNSISAVSLAIALAGGESK